MVTAEPHTPSRRTTVTSFAVLAASVVLMWILSLLGPLSLLVVVIAIGVLDYFLRRRRYLAALLLALTTPFSVHFLVGLVDYTRGDAQLRYSGLPETTIHNLDRELRCGRATHGCIVVGHEWVHQLPYNAAVRLLTATCGPMPGTYAGPYPTAEEAKNAVANGSSVSVEDLASDRLSLGGETIPLDDGVGAELAERLVYRNIWFRSTVPPDIKATIWKRECIVLRIPVSVYWNDEEDTSAAIVLLSRKAGRPFAYFAEGEYSHHFPPVSWKRRWLSIIRAASKSSSQYRQGRPRNRINGFFEDRPSGLSGLISWVIRSVWRSTGASFASLRPAPATLAWIVRCTIEKLTDD